MITPEMVKGAGGPELFTYTAGQDFRRALRRMLDKQSDAVSFEMGRIAPGQVCIVLTWPKELAELFMEGLPAVQANLLQVAQTLLEEAEKQRQQPYNANAGPSSGPDAPKAA